MRLRLAGRAYPLAGRAYPLAGRAYPLAGRNDGATLHAPAPHGSEITLGFRQLVMSHSSGWMAELQPVGPAYGVGGPNTRQDFALSTAWDGKALSLIPAPALVHASALDDAQAAVQQAQKQIADLQAEIATLKESLLNAPTPAEVAALAAIRSALATLSQAEGISAA